MLVGNQRRRKRKSLQKWTKQSNWMWTSPILLRDLEERRKLTMLNFTELPDDIWNIIWDMKSSMEHHENMKTVIVELYFHGFLRRRPRHLHSIWWTVKNIF